MTTTREHRTVEPLNSSHEDEDYPRLWLGLKVIFWIDLLSLAAFYFTD